MAVTDTHTYYIYKAKGSRTKLAPAFTLQNLLFSKFSSTEINSYKALYVCWCSVWERKATSQTEWRNTLNVPENRMLKRRTGCKIFWSFHRNGGTSLPATTIIKWSTFITRSIIYSVYYTSGHATYCKCNEDESPWVWSFHRWVHHDIRIGQKTN